MCLIKSRWYLPVYQREYKNSTLIIYISTIASDIQLYYTILRINNGYKHSKIKKYNISKIREIFIKRNSENDWNTIYNTYRLLKSNLGSLLYNYEKYGNKFYWYI